MTKNIVIILLSVSPERVTGGSAYVRNILDNILAADKDNFYHLILSTTNSRYFKNRYDNYQNVQFYVFGICRDITINPLRGFKKLLAKVGRNQQVKEAIIKEEVQSIIDRSGVDIVFYPSGNMYPTGLKNAKTIVTIFDLQHEYISNSNNFSEEYLARRKRDSMYATHNSSHLIAISEFTKQSLVEKYGISPDKISVIYLASHQKTTDCLSSIKLPEDFIFYPAAVWPHKHHRVLVGALNLLKSEFPDLHIIFSGLLKNKKSKEEILAWAASCGLKDKVHFLGFVLDEDMSCIYKKTKILVYPSSFEGFGIPLVEAFSYGVPVIAADNTSISEVVGTAGILVETGNVQALADAIKRVLLNDGLRADLVKRGYERAKDFSWTVAAKKTVELFNSL